MSYIAFSLRVWGQALSLMNGNLTDRWGKEHPLHLHHFIGWVCARYLLLSK